MKKSFLLCATAILLGACGGGGGGGTTPTAAPTPTVNPDTVSSGSSSENKYSRESDQQASQTTEQVSENKSGNEIMLPTQDKPTEKKLSNTGFFIDKNRFHKGELEGLDIKNTNGNTIATLSGHNRRYTFNGALVKAPDATQLIVDGVVLKLIDENVGQIGGLTGLALSKALTAAYNVSKDPKRDIFYFGLETGTADMPKSGIATYRGNASRYDNISGNVTNIGTSTLYADFGRKKISGDLAINNGVLGAFRRDISLKETDIKGNGFSGRATAGEDNILFRTVEGRYEGKFYGPKAEEVAGKATFQGEAIVGQLESLNTSFSAERGAIH